MSSELTLRGIAVGRKLASEGSARILIYTDGFGLLEALAHSVREERSKLRSHLQEGTMGWYTFVRGANWRITGAVDTRNVYFEFGEDSKGKEAVARVIKTVRQFIRGEGSDPYLFSVLWHFLIDAKRFGPSMREAECLAVLRLLSCLGYVNDLGEAQGFMSSQYDGDTLTRARASRGSLVRTINAGIAESGM